MRFYWSYKSLPELANVSQSERKRIWKLCQAKAIRHPIAWLVWGVWLFMMVNPSVLIQKLIPSPSYPILIGAGFGLTWFIVWAVPASQIFLWLGRKHIAAELPGHCRGCGYDLTGNISGNCPECGKVT